MISWNHSLLVSYDSQESALIVEIQIEQYGYKVNITVGFQV